MHLKIIMMRREGHETGAAAITEGHLAVSNLATLHDQLRPCFARMKPFAQARKYVAGLISDLPRKNGWTLAEHAGDATPDRTQRLLNHAVWDENQAMGVVRRYVAQHLQDQQLVVAALDESGQEKTGQATAGVQRQYMGCAGRIANGVNIVYCTYATPGGHALVGARIYVPHDQLRDPDRRTAMGIGAEVVFRTKPQLARAMVADLIAEGCMPSWAAGDEVYGRSGELRMFLEEHQVGYVLRVGCAFHVEVAPDVKAAPTRWWPDSSDRTPGRSAR